jgi:hypothetical protein
MKMEYPTQLEIYAPKCDDPRTQVKSDSRKRYRMEEVVCFYFTSFTSENGDSTRGGGAPLCRFVPSRRDEFR